MSSTTTTPSSAAYTALASFLAGDKPEERKKARECIKKVKFDKKILISGCGAITQCILPLFPVYLEFNWANVTIIDRIDKKTSKFVVDFVAKGGKFVQEDFKPTDFAQKLPKYVSEGDFWLDLTVESGTPDFVEWCKKAGVLYVNAAFENWAETLESNEDDLSELSLYADWTSLNDRLATLGPNDGATAVVGCGANPGIVYHFCKQGLEDIANAVLAKEPKDEKRNAVIKEALEKEQWNVLSQALGIKVIHVSEKDSQITNEPKRANEFVNTWSCNGMYDESILPAELTWGTHEKKLPDNAITHERGPKHMISLKTMGMNTFVRSWNPDGEFRGRVILHEENFHLGLGLEIRDSKGDVTYRPTIHYAYSASESASQSLDEVRNNNYKYQENLRVLGDEIVSGRDCLGVLLMGHDFEAWWTGSLLDIEETRTLVGKGQNATTLQVSAGVMGAVVWAVQNPKQGIISCYKIPHREILALAKPYLGPWASKPVDWNPIKSIKAEDKNVFIKKDIYKVDESEKWQFQTFLSHSF